MESISIYEMADLAIVESVPVYNKKMAHLTKVESVSVYEEMADLAIVEYVSEYEEMADVAHQCSEMSDTVWMWGSGCCITWMRSLSFLS